MRRQDGPQMRAPRTEFAETSKPWSPCRATFLSMLRPISNFIWESPMTKKSGSLMWRLLGVELELGVAPARWTVTLRPTEHLASQSGSIRPLKYGWI